MPKKKQRHPGKRQKKLSPAKRVAARALAEGKNCGEAAVLAGLKSKRARKGITVAEWNGEGPHSDPAFKQEVVDWTKKQMDAPEINGRLAEKARAVEPADMKKDHLKALELLGHHLGLRKSRLTLDTDDEIDLTQLSSEELDTLMKLQEKARKSAGDGADNTDG